MEVGMHFLLFVHLGISSLGMVVIFCLFCWQRRRVKPLGIAMVGCIPCPDLLSENCLIRFVLLVLDCTFWRILGQTCLLVQFYGPRIRVQGIMLRFSQRRHPRICEIPLVFDHLKVQLVSSNLFQPGWLLHWLIWRWSKGNPLGRQWWLQLELQDLFQVTDLVFDSVVPVHPFLPWW